MMKVGPPGTCGTLRCCYWPPPLLPQAAYQEAHTCRVESRYLEVLRQLQDTRTLDASQQEAVEKLVEDALKRETERAGKAQVTR